MDPIHAEMASTDSAMDPTEKTPMLTATAECPRCAARVEVDAGRYLNARTAGLPVPGWLLLAMLRADGHRCEPPPVERAAAAIAGAHRTRGRVP